MTRFRIAAAGLVFVLLGFASDVGAQTAEVSAWRGRLEAACRQGRDLVREDQFDRAEAILRDLSQVPDERAGRMAREFLAFEFSNRKATRLLQNGDVAGAERLLDTASTVDRQRR